MPVSPEVVAIVRQRQLVVPRGNPSLFPGDVIGKLVREIRCFWTHVQKEAHLSGLRIHDLRHTFASLFVSGAASLEIIGKFLGHSQLQTTQRYAHLMDSPLRADVDTVASLLRPSPRLVNDADAPGVGLGTNAAVGGDGSSAAIAASAALPKSDGTAETRSRPSDGLLVFSLRQAQSAVCGSCFRRARRPLGCSGRTSPAPMSPTRVRTD